MNKFTNRFYKVLKNPWLLLAHIINKFNYLFSDKIFLSIQFKAYLGKWIDWKNPKTFNEKLQWLKLYYRKPEYTELVDKNTAKRKVAELIGEEYIIPTIAIYKKFEDIDFDTLPNQFVLKCTHNSGGVIVCDDKNKLDKTKCRNVIKKSLKQNFYYVLREWPYKNVIPQIIVEKYMSDGTGNNLNDYKLFCFNGKARMILVCKDRYKETGLTEDFFSINWEHLNIKRPNHPNSTSIINKPLCLDLMVNLANQLSKDMPFVRIDFYEINGKVYFGEITFFPASGIVPFVPNEWDYILGSWIDLP